MLDVVFSNKAGAGGAAVEVEMEMALCQRTILTLEGMVLTLKMANLILDVIVLTLKKAKGRPCKAPISTLGWHVDKALAGQ